MKRCAGGNADQDAFLSADKSACGKRIFVGNRDDLVIDLCVEHIGNEACTDTLNFMCARDALRQNGRRSRLDSNDLHGRITAFQILTDAGNRAAGADACNEVIDFTVRIRVDFGACCLDMGLRV